MSPFAPTHGIDLFINPVYMGDYDQLTSDFLNSNSGFIGSFPEPDYAWQPGRSRSLR